MSKQHKKPGARDDASSKSASSSHDEVLALIKERRKYVDWIRALEAKREQTSPQAYERVHLDYQNRLDAVAEKLAAHRDTLSAEQSTLERKLADLDGEIQEHQDDRAETELRAHVGELTAAALTEALRVADTEIDRLTAKRNAVAKDLSRIAEFFAAADGTTPAATPSAAPRGKAGFDEMSFLNSVVGPNDRAPVRPSQETRAQASPVAESPPLRPVEVPSAPPMEAPPAPRPSTPTPRPSTPTPIPAVPERPSTPTPAVPERPSTPTPAVPERPSTPTPAPAPAPSPTPAPTPEPPTVPVAPPRTSVERPIAAEVVQADGAVDKAVELEITPKPVSRPSIAMQMASLTLDPDAKPMAKADSLGIIKTGDELPPSILADLQPGTASGEKPFAANVASNNPLSLRSTGPTDLKTLKCRDCGSMNDPSEWYCERCGAELSSM